MFDNETVLVTGGAGSIGSQLVKKLLDYPVRSVRVFDNDEYGLFLLKRRLRDERLRLLLGNIIDRERVKLALRGVDTVYHLAAIKNIEISEFNCPQCIRTNVDGTINLIECALETRPEKFLFCSSDKAVDHALLYGATKFLGEKLTLWAHRVQNDTIFSVARFPNVMETRGNVFEVFEEQKRQGKPLTVTHPEMRRYVMGLNEATDFIVEATEMMRGGEIFVPADIKEYKILDIARGLSDKVEISGIRVGEKLSERLMTPEEEGTAERRGSMWVIRCDRGTSAGSTAGGSRGER